MRLGQQKFTAKVKSSEAQLGYNMTNMDPADWHFNKKLSGGGSLQNPSVYCVQASRYIWERRAHHSDCLFWSQ